MGGLVCYDGFCMQLFDVYGQENELLDVYVCVLLVLFDGGVLVGMNVGGLVCFDLVGNCFYIYFIGIGGSSDCKIYSLVVDGMCGVWIVIDCGLDYLDFGCNMFIYIVIGDVLVLCNFSVLQDCQGNFWLGNDCGLFVCEYGSQVFVCLISVDVIVVIVLYNQIWVLYEDVEGCLWVGSGQIGVVYCDIDGYWCLVLGFSFNDV